METDYRIEKQPARLDSDLHGRYREFVTPGYLSLAGSRAQCISYLYALSDHGIYMAAGAGSDVFSGLLYLIITVTTLRERMISCIPPSMKNAISAGLRMFIALIGLLNAGILVAENESMSLRQVTAPHVFLAVAGVMITGVLMAGCLFCRL